MGTQNTVWERLRLTWTGRAARRVYWKLDDRLDDLRGKLSRTSAPADRAMLLAKMCRAAKDQAEIHDAVWGVDWLDDNNMDMAQSMRWSSLLYRLLADVEQAVAYPELGRRDTTTELERVACPILNTMAKVPDLLERMTHLPALYDAVYGKVGGQAALVVACLGYPGRKR